MPLLPRLLACSLLLLNAVSPAAQAAERPNLLLVTVDDMSADSLGCYGADLKGTSPNIDHLAAKSLCFDLAHVQVGNCYPSRNVMWSGRYPHNNGAEGFYQVNPIDYPVLCDVMKGAGYWLGIRGKVSHSTPYQPYDWDEDLTITPDGETEPLKDAASYGRSVRRGIEAATSVGKPFCINVNISDPHKPFWFPGDPHEVSRIFTADEVSVPGFLPDDPAIREELALYYTSVRRADDCVGEILAALEDSGFSDDTFVLFLSDHGMPLPFAKTQLYHHSTRTPLIVRWPGNTEAGRRDADHMVSAVDFLPTLCEVAGIEAPSGMDGRSFAPLLRGEMQEDRDAVFKVYNENSGGSRNPIRAVQSKRYLYLFSPWVDGKTTFATATRGTASYKRMKALAAEDPAVAARLELYEYGSLEEFYDVTSDPDCLVNLIDAADHREAIDQHRARLEHFLEETGDHALDVFRNRNDQAAREAYMKRVSTEAAERRAKKKGKGGKAKAKKKAA